MRGGKYGDVQMKCNAVRVLLSYVCVNVILGRGGGDNVWELEAKV